MSTTIATTVYTFDELSDRAKETARQWWRDGRDSNDFDHVIEDAVHMGEIFGIAFRTHPVKLMNGNTRHDPNVWWQVSYTQNDGASFEGSYSYAKGAHRKIRAEAPQDERLHEMADDLLAIQRQHSYAISATIANRGASSFYPEITIDCAHCQDMTEEDGKQIDDVFRRYCRWIYDQLRQEDEYQNEDEQVDENIRANEYTFTADGKRFG